MSTDETEETLVSNRDQDATMGSKQHTNRIRLTFREYCSLYESCCCKLYALMNYEMNDWQCIETEMIFTVLFHFLFVGMNFVCFLVLSLCQKQFSMRQQHPTIVTVVPSHIIHHSPWHPPPHHAAGPPPSRRLRPIYR